MSATQSYLLQNQPAGNYTVGVSPSSAWTGYRGGVLGGVYAFMFAGTGTGTATLQALGPDGATWIAAGSQITTNSGYQVVQLPPGQYRISITGFTGCYASLTRLPN